MSLTDETKKAMGYVEKPGTCKRCKYHESRAGVLDRTWDELCSYSNLCKFEVKESATCAKFEEATK